LQLQASPLPSPSSNLVLPQIRIITPLLPSLITRDSQPHPPCAITESARHIGSESSAKIVRMLEFKVALRVRLSSSFHLPKSFFPNEGESIRPLNGFLFCSSIFLSPTYLPTLLFVSRSFPPHHLSGRVHGRVFMRPDDAKAISSSPSFSRFLFTTLAGLPALPHAKS